MDGIEREDALRSIEEKLQKTLEELVQIQTGLEANEKMRSLG